MAKSRESFKKRKKELERKEKKDQKRQRKLDKKTLKAEENPNQLQNEGDSILAQKPNEKNKQTCSPYFR